MLLQSSKIVLVAGLLAIGSAANSQKIGKIYENAQDLFYSEALAEALLLYEEVLRLDPEYEDATYKAEICSLLTAYREKPLDNILAFGEDVGSRDKFYHYWLGRIYVTRYQFAEAIQSWKTFLSAKNAKSTEIRTETKDFIGDARQKLTFFENTDDYEIHQLEEPINSPAAELTPAYNKAKNELLFASSRGSSGGNEVFRIYHAIKADQGWTDIREINILGEFDRSSANIEVVDEDGKLFVFDDKGKGSLFYSENNNGNWVLPVEFDSKVSAAHIKSHFFINEHEDRIVFASDKNYKRQGLDLYQSYRDAETGKWSKPAPFGIEINSTGDEDSPYLSHDEKTLFFSSNGHNSIGGYDVFKSELDPETLKWSTPKNMGFPINSPDDEVHFKINADGRSGYFSSDRLHTAGDFDIYFFWEIEKINIEGRVMDVAAKSPVRDAVIRFTPSQYTDEHFTSKIDDKGNYSTEIISDETYLIEILQNNQTLFVDQFEIHAAGDINTTYIKDFLFNKPRETNPDLTASIDDNPSDNPPSPGEVSNREEEPKSTPSTTNESASEPATGSIASTAGREATAGPTPTNKEAAYSLGRKLIVDNIYFGTGTASFRETATETLSKALKTLQGNPQLRVEVGGHTDNIGSPDANLWVSQNRAKAVKNWLVANGIAEDRILIRGYADKFPLASNDDEQAGRELNRRIEIRVIE